MWQDPVDSRLDALLADHVAFATRLRAATAGREGAVARWLSAEGRDHLALVHVLETLASEQTLLNDYRALLNALAWHLRQR